MGSLADVAAFTMVFKRGGAVAGLVAAVVALFAGVHFPVEQLPRAVRWAAEALPFTWGVTPLRTSLLLDEVDTAHPLGVVVAAAAVLLVSLVPFGRAVDQARHQGTLAQF